VQIRLDQPLAHALEELERRFIEHALSASGGRVADAAQLLGLSRKGLFLKRRRCGLVSVRPA
jgi:DNA-binding NtrC family response regulator